MNENIKEIKSLYDSTPYATYDVDFSCILNSTDPIKYNFNTKNALEVGCGGGHISIFLSRVFKTVLGVDLSEKSIKMANSKKEEMNVGNIHFSQKNLFDDSFTENNLEKHDYILCYGVLHHTPDPKAGFLRLVKMLKPGGVICVGLYSRTLLMYRLKRRMVLWFSGSDLQKRKTYAQKWFFGNEERDLLISDAYVNPVVSFHSIREVIGWIAETKLEYDGSYPPIELTAYPRLILKKKFDRSRQSKIERIINYNRLSFFLVELLWVISGKSVMVNISAKKPD